MNLVTPRGLAEVGEKGGKGRGITKRETFKRAALFATTRRIEGTKKESPLIGGA